MTKVITKNFDFNSSFTKILHRQDPSDRMAGFRKRDELKFLAIIFLRLESLSMLFYIKPHFRLYALD